ncbi:MAG TPA: hypothetical protein PLB38_00655 [bacterium]|nr:hypothetical protein [bacterium]
MKKLTIFVAVLAIFGLGACQWGTKNPADKTADNNVPQEKPVVQSPAEMENAIKNLSSDILTLLKNKDFENLAFKIHPTQGIRFSPYAYVSKDDLHFSADDFLQLTSDEKTRIWGYADGSGFPIELNFNDYYKKYIWDLDFTRAPESSFDKRLGQGNSLDNALEFYAGAHVVEYYFAGFDPQYEGMDWRSLRLVFAEENGQWYLVGIIHDQWTI